MVWQWIRAHGKALLDSHEKVADWFRCSLFLRHALRMVLARRGRVMFRRRVCGGGRLLLRWWRRRRAAAAAAAALRGGAVALASW